MQKNLKITLLGSRVEVGKKKEREREEEGKTIASSQLCHPPPLCNIISLSTLLFLLLQLYSSNINMFSTTYQEIGSW